MSNSSRSTGGFFLALAAGVAVGVAIGYFLNSEEKDELMNTVRDKASHLKEKAGQFKERVKDKLHHVEDPIDEVTG